MPIETDKLEKLKQRMAEISWYHQIDLGPELGITPGICTNDKTRLAYMHLPETFENHHVIDVGSWDGYFAFEAARRGASVLATDTWGDSAINDGEGIRFACEVLEPNIQLLYSNVYELATSVWNQDPEYMADDVIFAGVLYHLQHPLAALEQIYKILVPGGLLILETHLDLLTLRRPAMALYREDEASAGDHTNFCGPNPIAVELMLKWAGFHDIQFQGGINLEEFADLQTINKARGAWHARK